MNMRTPRSLDYALPRTPQSRFARDDNPVEKGLVRRRLKPCPSPRSNSIHHEVLGLGMVDDDGGGGLFGLELEGVCKADADGLLGMQQREELGLVFEVGAGRVSEGVARAAVLLVEEVGDARGVVLGDAELFSDFLVHKFGEGFGGFNAESVAIEVAGEFAGVEELFGDLGGAAADGDAGEADHVEATARARGEEIGDAEAAAFALAREGEAEQFPALLFRIVDDHVVAVALAGGEY